VKCVGGALRGCTGPPGCFLAGVLRILSDLHLYDAGTRVRELPQLEPLLAGVRTLVINGDSCEMRHGIGVNRAPDMQRFFRDRVAEAVFVTGNHDPDISDTHELLLAGGRVWVTHGDVCFGDLTPWSRHQPELQRLVEAELAKDPAADYRQLATRFRVARHAARNVSDRVDRSDPRLRARLKWLWDTFFPPRQPLAMLRAWRELPVRAAALAAAVRPEARVAVMGHVHLPGVWHTPPGPIVVNTGSFFAPLGGHLVDLDGDVLHVRRIVRRGGRFYPGRQMAMIPLGG
jgi:predicted phosphodiesterase